MNQAANTVDLRKTRLRGLKKVELEHVLAAAAIAFGFAVGDAVPAPAPGADYTPNA